MTRGFWLGLLAAAVAFLALLAIAARFIDAGTDTIEGAGNGWLAACGIVGLVAGFIGARVARSAPRPARYAAAMTGPAAIALLFALTTTARDANGPWIALAIAILAAALGAAGRDAAANAQRRR